MKIAVFAPNMRFFREISNEIGKVHEVRFFKEPNVSIPFGKARYQRHLSRKRMDALMSWADISFFEWAGQYLAEATQLPKRSRIVARMHRFEIFSHGDKVKWENVDRVILIGEGMRQKVLRNRADLEGKIAVIPNAIDMKQFASIKRRPSERITIGALGNIIPRKRIYELVLAFHELCKRDDRFLLRLGGKCGTEILEKEYCPMIKRLIAQLGLEGKAIMEGHVESLPDWYAGIDIFVNNSYDEGYAVSVQEAVLSGCYPLVHAWEGADEYVPKENLFHSSHELVEKLLSYEKNKPWPERERVAKNIKDRCNIETVSKQFIEVLEAVGKGI